MSKGLKMIDLTKMKKQLDLKKMKDNMNNILALKVAMGKRKMELDT